MFSITNKIKSLLLTLTILVMATGCTITKVPTPIGNAWSVRVLNWTEIGNLNMRASDSGGTNFSLQMNDYIGRADSEAIKSSGTAFGEVGGTIIDHLKTP